MLRNWPATDALMCQALFKWCKYCMKETHDALELVRRGCQMNEGHSRGMKGPAKDQSRTELS